MQKISYCKRVTEPSCMFRKKIVFLPVFMNGINCFCIHLIPPHKYLRYVHTVSAVSHCAPSNLSVPAFLSWLCHGWSLLLIDIEKGQSIFSAALVGGYSILVCCFQIYKIACCSAIAIFSIPFSCYFINISAQFKSEYVSNNSYIFAVCSRLSPMFVTPALHT